MPKDRDIETLRDLAMPGPDRTEETALDSINFSRLCRRKIEGCLERGSMSGDAGLTLLLASPIASALSSTPLRVALPNQATYA